VNPPPEPLSAAIAASGLDATGDLGMGSVAGTDVEYRFDPQRTTELLADAVARLHEVVPMTSTASLSMSDVVAEAEERMGHDPLPTLDSAYQHLTHDRLLEVLADGARSLGDDDSDGLVLTHGRADLVSLRCRDGVAVGFCEWERAAMADRHRDLAHAATAVASSLGPMLVPVFFESYGRRPDPRRLDWWALALQLTDASARGISQ
jgi:aminoglycoside phosphotransferase